MEFKTDIGTRFVVGLAFEPAGTHSNVWIVYLGPLTITLKF